MKIWIIAALAAVIAVGGMACVDFTRLDIEAQGATTTQDGIIVEVKVSNTGESQEILSVATGLYGVDTAGNTWAAVDECSTLDGQTVAEGRPVTGTICFPFRKADDQGVVVDYVPQGTQILYILATDNLFVGDTDKFFIHPVETAQPAQPAQPDPGSPGSGTATVEVRVWQDVNDPLKIYISARPADGNWATLGTIPLPLDDGLSSSGRFRYGDISLDVPLD